MDSKLFKNQQAPFKVVKGNLILASWDFNFLVVAKQPISRYTNRFPQEHVASCYHPPFSGQLGQKGKTILKVIITLRKL